MPGSKRRSNVKISDDCYYYPFLVCPIFLFLFISGIMRKLSLSVALKLLFPCIFISFHVTCAASEEFAVTKPAPFHNLIPRFKMPTGNLLRYKIPQWEVLYYLKYGIVPFIFYDPHFNRTNFITQVHKFKMYFDDGRSTSRTTAQFALKDDDSFREFLRNHGYPNYNKLPENALSRNNELAEEINEELRTTSTIVNEKGNGDKKLQAPEFSPFEVIMKGLNPETNESTRDKSEDLEVTKRENVGIRNHKQGRQSFWNTFITRYPVTWKYTRSVLGTRNLLLNHDLSWTRDRTPHSGFARNSKTFRVGLRNGDTGGGDGDDGSGSGDTRKGGKFQTQGW